MFCEYCGRKRKGDQAQCMYCKKEFRSLKANEDSIPISKTVTPARTMDVPPATLKCPFAGQRPRGNASAVMLLLISIILLLCVIGTVIIGAKMVTEMKTQKKQLEKAINDINNWGEDSYNGEDPYYNGGDREEPIEIKIKKNDTAETIANNLKDAGVILDEDVKELIDNLEAALKENKLEGQIQSTPIEIPSDCFNDIESIIGIIIEKQKELSRIQ